MKIRLIVASAFVAAGLAVTPQSAHAAEIPDCLKILGGGGSQTVAVPRAALSPSAAIDPCQYSNQITCRNEHSMIFFARDMTWQAQSLNSCNHAMPKVWASTQIITDVATLGLLYEESPSPAQVARRVCCRG
jgi:hypothetical protein